MPQKQTFEGLEFFDDGDNVFRTIRPETFPTPTGAINIPLVLPDGKVVGPREAFEFYRRHDPSKLKAFPNFEIGKAVADNIKSRHLKTLAKFREHIPGLYSSRRNVEDFNTPFLTKEQQLNFNLYGTQPTDDQLRAIEEYKPFQKRFEEGKGNWTPEVDAVFKRLPNKIQGEAANRVVQDEQFRANKEGASQREVLDFSFIPQDSYMAKVMEFQRLKSGGSPDVHMLLEEGRRAGLDKTLKTQTSDTEFELLPQVKPSFRGPILQSKEQRKKIFKASFDLGVKWQPLDKMAKDFAKSDRHPANVNKFEFAELSDDDFSILKGLVNKRLEESSGNRSGLEKFRAHLDRGKANFTTGLADLTAAIIGDDKIIKGQNRRQQLVGVIRGADPANTKSEFLNSGLSAAEQIFPQGMAIALGGASKSSLLSRLAVTTTFIPMGVSTLLNTMTEAGVKSEIAKPLALLGSIPYALAESLAVRGLIPKGLVKSEVTRQVAGSVREAFLNAVLKRGAEAFGELVEEGLQSGIDAGVHKLATILDKEAPKIDWDEKLVNAKAELNEAWKVIGWMSAGGSIIQTRAEVGETIDKLTTESLAKDIFRDIEVRKDLEQDEAIAIEGETKVPLKGTTDSKANASIVRDDSGNVSLRRKGETDPEIDRLWKIPRSEVFLGTEANKRTEKEVREDAFDAIDPDGEPGLTKTIVTEEAVRAFFENRRGTGLFGKIPGDIDITYRDKSGIPAATIHLTLSEDGSQPYDVVKFAADPSLGLLSGRAAIAVAEAALEIGININPTQMTDASLTLLHKHAVRIAVDEGQDVPANVLADYPELEKKAKRGKKVSLKDETRKIRGFETGARAIVRPNGTITIFDHNGNKVAENIDKSKAPEVVEYLSKLKNVENRDVSVINVEENPQVIKENYITHLAIGPQANLPTVEDTNISVGGASDVNIPAALNTRVSKRSYIKPFVDGISNVVNTLGKLLTESDGNAQYANTSLMNILTGTDLYAANFRRVFTDGSNGIGICPFVLFEGDTKPQSTEQLNEKAWRLFGYLIHEFAHTNIRSKEPGDLGGLLEAEIVRLFSHVDISAQEAMVQNIQEVLTTLQESKEFKNDTNDLSAITNQSKRRSTTNTAAKQRDSRSKKSSKSSESRKSKTRSEQSSPVNAEVVQGDDKANEGSIVDEISDKDTLKKATATITQILEVKRGLARTKNKKGPQAKKLQGELVRLSQHLKRPVKEGGLGVTLEQRRALEKALKQIPRALRTPSKELSKGNSKDSTSTTYKGGETKEGRKEIDTLPTLTKLQKWNKLWYKVLGGFTPAKAVQKIFGDDIWALILTKFHQGAARTVGFFDTQLLAFEEDLTYRALGQAMDKLPPRVQKNLFLAWAGTAVTEEGKIRQKEALDSLTPEQRILVSALREISNFNWDLLDSLNTGAAFFKNYFFGLYKSDQNLSDFLEDRNLSGLTDKFKNPKLIKSMADAVTTYNLTPKTWNPVWNLRAEYGHISNYKAMIDLRSELRKMPNVYRITKNLTPAEVRELNRRGWRKIGHGAEKLFGEAKIEPNVHRLLTNLLKHNGFSAGPVRCAIRGTFQFSQGVYFLAGPIFHVGTVIRQAINDTLMLAFLRPKSWKAGLRFFKNFGVDPSKMPPAQQASMVRWMETGGVLRGAHEQEATNRLEHVLTHDFYENFVLNGIIETIRLPFRVGTLPMRFLARHLFQNWIPSLKLYKFTEWYDRIVQDKGKPPTQAQQIEFNLETQNLVGEMNEKLFGWSGTVTSFLRLWQWAPGFKIGDFGTMYRALFRGRQGNRSRRNILQAFVYNIIFVTVAERILTGLWKKPPERLEDLPDLMKIDTGDRYTEGTNKGEKIMIDTRSFENDYMTGFDGIVKIWNGEVGEGMVQASLDLTKRLTGSNTGLFLTMVDIANLTSGDNKVHDWRNNEVIDMTEPWEKRVLQFLRHEMEYQTPIGLSQYLRNRQQGVSAGFSLLFAATGLRLGVTEEFQREKKLYQLYHVLRRKRGDVYRGIALEKFTESEMKNINEKISKFLSLPDMTPMLKRSFDVKRHFTPVSIEDYQAHLVINLAKHAASDFLNPGVKSTEKNIDIYTKALEAQGYDTPEKRHFLLKFTKDNQRYIDSMTPTVKIPKGIRDNILLLR